MRAAQSTRPIPTTRPLRLIVAGLLALSAVLGSWLLDGRQVAGQEQPPLSPQTVEAAFPNVSFPQMTNLTHAADGTDRLWVALQPGQVFVFPNDPQAASASVFLDIRGRVRDIGNEEGLLGLAFDPAYVSNGYFYVYYSASSPRHSVVSRFSVRANDSNRADPTTELVLLEVEQPYSNHNGGNLAFGPDGYLYVGLGDGGLRADPHGNGQDTSTLLGSILRIDVSAATADEPYRIPPDNPLLGIAGARGEIWAYGLRNPWKFAFDTATDNLWVADVGQNDYEEVDLVTPGGNYGWVVMEGFHCYPPNSQGCDKASLQPPIVEYGHDQGCSITGGYVYRGSRLPVLSNAYLYADFCSGRIWALRYDYDVGAVIDHVLLADTTLQIPAFGIDEAGEVYILASDGRIYRFASPEADEPRPSGTPVPTPTPTAAPSATPTRTPASTPTGAPTVAKHLTLTLDSTPPLTPTSVPTLTPPTASPRVDPALLGILFGGAVLAITIAPMVWRRLRR
jgi:glucose/arabinose dehydrogenase